MNTGKKTGKNNFSLPFFSSKEKRRKMRTEGLSTMLQELRLKPVQIQEQSVQNNRAIKNRIGKKQVKNIFCFIPFLFVKEKRKKIRTEGVSKTLYELGLSSSPTQEQYARTRASVQQEIEKESISSSFSSSLPVSLL